MQNRRVETRPNTVKFQYRRSIFDLTRKDKKEQDFLLSVLTLQCARNFSTLTGYANVIGAVRFPVSKRRHLSPFKYDALLSSFAGRGGDRGESLLNALNFRRPSTFRSNR